MNKATGPDDISHTVLRNTATTISRPLTYIFNMSLQSSCYPALWKDANVIPLFKKGERSQPGNYRPISLLSCIGKVFERVIFKHIYDDLVDNLVEDSYLVIHCPSTYRNV